MDKTRHQEIEIRTIQYQGSKRAKASGGDFKPFLPLATPPHPHHAKYFLTTFTLISEKIKFDLSGADFSPRAEKLEP